MCDAEALAGHQAEMTALANATGCQGPAFREPELPKSLCHPFEAPVKPKYLSSRKKKHSLDLSLDICPPSPPRELLVNKP